MKNLILKTLVLFVLGQTIVFSQTNKNLNLDFEVINSNRFPENWKNNAQGSYTTQLDSTTVQKGNYSLVIEGNNEADNVNVLVSSLSENYKGKTIVFSGYIKTENITEGYAGLWMRIDPQIAFDNMMHNGVKGTTDWQKYEIELQMNPEKTDNIVFGALLVGTGKMWIDNLKITVDGKSVEDGNLEIIKRELKPAEEDKAFDKGSDISFSDLDKETINNLDLLGKVWGFVKYHHPTIAAGEYNWDYELFRMLPNYLKVSNTNERDKLLTDWIKKYSSVPICENCSKSIEGIDPKTEFAWIENYDVSSELKASINHIFNNRNQRDNFYVSLKEGVQNPDFSNENTYLNMPFPDKGFRLLSLYRYWNIINYFFPNKHITDKDWDTVLKEYIPKFLNAESELDYELAALQIIGDVKDTHANLWGGGDKIQELRGSFYAPFKAEFVENKFVVTDYYNPELASVSKLKIGDVITKIKGKSIKHLVDSLSIYYPASNKPTRLRNISEDLLRSNDKIIEVEYITSNKKSIHHLKLYKGNELNMYYWFKVNENEKCFKILDNNIGYITLANIKDEDVLEIKKQLKDTKGIIIDIRNYPSAFVPFSLGSFFMDEPTDFVKFSKGNVNNPGQFTINENTKIPASEDYYRGKLVILVNEKTQSSAEYHAMAFRASKNATVIGSTTAGADGNVSQIFLPGGLRTMISGIGVYYPDGTNTQRVGIVPDIIIKPTINGIKSGKDEVLEKAIQIINE
ncbi:S41 family peptidase [Lacinutrix salivirga]